MERGKRFLTGIFSRDEEAALTRRDALAGLGLGALLAATAKFVAPSAAHGKPLDKPAEAAASPAPEGKAAKTQVAEGSDATDLSSQHWRRRRRRYWRRRWRWRRRYYWRRRHWRRRYWRRRRWW